MHPHHNHVYKNQKEADRIIAQFRKKPSNETRQSIQEMLFQERQRFFAIERVRERLQRSRGNVETREL